MTAHEGTMTGKEPEKKPEMTEEVKEHHKKKEKHEDYKKELEEKEKTIKDLTETLKRLQAEFENYRKRNEAEQAKIVRAVEKEILKGFLTLLDDLELALKSHKEDTEFYKGIQHIHTKFLTLLNDLGCRHEPAVGKKFDPHKHEALMTEETPGKEDNTVLEEFQKCYCIGGDVVRFARVKVAKRPNTQKETSQDNQENKAKEE